MEGPSAAGTWRTRSVDTITFQSSSVTASTFPCRLKHRDAALTMARWAITAFFRHADSCASTARTLFGLIMADRIISHRYFKFLIRKTTPNINRKAPSAATIDA